MIALSLLILAVTARFLCKSYARFASALSFLSSAACAGNDFAGRVDEYEVVDGEAPTFLDESTDKRVAQRMSYRFVLSYPQKMLSEATAQQLRHGVNWPPGSDL